MVDRTVRALLRSVSAELVSVVDEVSPSVVTVRHVDVELATGLGSGWAYGPDLVVTNAHVVAADRPVLTVRVHGGVIASAALVGSDTLTDLAVLRVDTDLPALEVRTETARRGELCLAFGSPLGDYPETVTLGMVSGLHRRLVQDDGWSVEDVIQTDAEIATGSSGGPLVDVDGRLLGVNTAMRTDGHGVGFAIPGETVASVIPELVEYGEVVRPRLGVRVDVIEHVVDGVTGERLRVGAAGNDSSFEWGDILISIDDRPLAGRRDLFAVMRRSLLGRSVPVCVERAGGRTTFEVRFQAG